MLLFTQMKASGVDFLSRMSFVQAGAWTVLPSGVSGMDGNLKYILDMSASS